MLVHVSATSPRKAKWSGPHTIKMVHFVLFHSVTCTTNSLVSRIHVNTTKLHNVTFTLVTTGVILRSLECSFRWTSGWVRGITGWYSRCQEHYPSFEGNLENIPQMNKGNINRKMPNFNWLELEIPLGMSTDDAQNSPWTLATWVCVYICGRWFYDVWLTYDFGIHAWCYSVSFSYSPSSSDHIMFAPSGLCCIRILSTIRLQQKSDWKSVQLPWSSYHYHHRSSRPSSCTIGRSMQIYHNDRFLSDACQLLRTHMLVVYG